MAIKDYYKVLDLSYTASANEIKRAYRRLAMKYHPDKTGGDAVAERHFREIKEAYEVLSDPTSRANYNFEWWQVNSQSRRFATLAFSPADILATCVALRRYLDSVDVFRMDHKALNFYIMEILSDKHLTVLTESKDNKTNRSIALTIIAASKYLEPKFSKEIAQRLDQLSNGDAEIMAIIHTYRKEKQRERRWQSYGSLIIFVLALVLSVMIYLLSR